MQLPSAQITRQILIPIALAVLASGTSASLLADEKQALRSDNVQVVLPDDQQTARVFIDGELSAVLQRSDRWKKPFLYPVLRPGWSDQKFSAGHGIVVAESPVRNSTGEPTGKSVPAASRVSVLSRNGDQFHVPDVGGYLAVDDVVPESALVVRTMQDSPMPYARKNKNAYDHKHHRGVWVSVDEVNGIRYWNEDGVIRPESVEVTNDDTAGRTLKLVNSWLGEDGQLVVRETTTHRFLPSHLIVTEIKFTNPGDGPVTFEDTKEGLFGVRMADELRERESGRITDAEGRAGEGEVWGHENRWVDYSGTKAGHTVGVTLFDHSANSRRSRYHVRGYGLFAINPFGQHAYSKNTQPENHLVLKKGESAAFTYGLWLHGDVSENEIAETAKAFEAIAHPTE